MVLLTQVKGVSKIGRHIGNRFMHVPELKR